MTWGRLRGLWLWTTQCWTSEGTWRGPSNPWPQEFGLLLSLEWDRNAVGEASLLPEFLAGRAAHLRGLLHQAGMLDWNAPWMLDD